jgi:hypothetical protein
LRNTNNRTTIIARKKLTRAEINDDNNTNNHRHQQYYNNNAVILLDKNIEDVTSGLQPQFSNCLHTIIEENALTMTNYIQAMMTETNLSDNYRKGVIKLIHIL